MLRLNLGPNNIGNHVAQVKGLLGIVMATDIKGHVGLQEAMASELQDSA